MKRVIVFWDYSNFYSTLRGLLAGDASQVKDFDYQRFVQTLVGGHDLIKIYFACSMAEGDRDGVGKFFEWVDYQPFFYVKTFERITNPSTGNATEKQVDVYLATQLVALAYENAYDIAVLISGDMDFLPAVEIVQQKGKVVTVVSADRTLSNVLQKRADKAILIDRPGEWHFEQFMKSRSPCG